MSGTLVSSYTYLLGPPGLLGRSRAGKQFVCRECQIGCLSMAAGDHDTIAVDVLAMPYFLTQAFDSNCDITQPDVLVVVLLSRAVVKLQHTWKLFLEIVIYRSGNGAPKLDEENAAKSASFAAICEFTFFELWIAFSFSQDPWRFLRRQ